MHWKDHAKRRHMSHKSMGASGAFFSLCALVSNVCVRGDDVCVSCGNVKFCLWCLPGTACLYSGPSPVDLACLRSHLLHACRDWYCGCHPQDTALGKDITRYSFSSVRAVVYGSSSKYAQQVGWFATYYFLCLSLYQVLFMRLVPGIFTRTRMIRTCSSYVAWRKTRMRCGLLYYF